MKKKKKVVKSDIKTEILFQSCLRNLATVPRFNQNWTFKCLRTFGSHSPSSLLISFCIFSFLLLLFLLSHKQIYLILFVGFMLGFFVVVLRFLWLIALETHGPTIICSSQQYCSVIFFILFLYTTLLPTYNSSSSTAAYFWFPSVFVTADSSLSIMKDQN